MTDLIVTSDGDVQTWMLNRPEARNALSPGLVDALSSALATAERTGVRSVVIHGAGRSFCAGADLAYLIDCSAQERSPRPFLASICDLTVAFEQSPVAMVAAIHGHAVAGGLELALACDVIVATPDALIGDGHVKNNLVPGGGSSVRILDRLGTATGTWLALSGELMFASALQSSGWIKTLVPADQLLAEAHDTASRLARVPAAAQTRFKQLLRGPAEPVRAALQHELDVFEEHWATSDVVDHLTRFLHPDPKDAS